MKIRGSGAKVALDEFGAISTVTKRWASPAFRPA